MMTVFDTRMSDTLSPHAGREAAPRPSARQVGWVAALGWPAVWTAVLAGALLGPSGLVLLWIGIVGVVVMGLHQVVRLLARSVSAANAVIDNAPGARADR